MRDKGRNTKAFLDNKGMLVITIRFYQVLLRKIRQILVGTIIRLHIKKLD